MEDCVIVTPNIEELCKPVEKDLSCIYQECKQTFKHRPALNMHLTLTHKLKGYGDYSRQSSVPRRFLCPVNSCQRSSKEKPFPCLRELRLHYRNIHAEKKFVCTQCDKKFATDAQLNLHQKRCGTLFVCNICHVPYSTKEAVSKHIWKQHSVTYSSEQVTIKLPTDDVNNKSSKGEVTISTTTSVPSSNSEGMSATDNSIPHPQPASISPLCVVEHNAAARSLRVVEQNGAASASINDSSPTNAPNDDVSRKYIRLLPKPLKLQIYSTTQKQSGFLSESISTSLSTVKETNSTQTDTLDEAIRYSGLSLSSRDVMTCTDDIPLPPCLPPPPPPVQSTRRSHGYNRSRVGVSNPHPMLASYSHLTQQICPNTSCHSYNYCHYPQDVHEYAPQQSYLPPYPHNSFHSPVISSPVIQERQATSYNVITPDGQNTFGTQTSGIDIGVGQCDDLDYITPSDFGTQTSFMEDAVTQIASNTEFGTQTILSTLIDEMTSSSSSIELQCELGNAPLQTSTTSDSETIEDMMSFGTQTAEQESVILPTPLHSNTEMSSFGTQTIEENNGPDKQLEIPEYCTSKEPPSDRPYLHQSTSDFAMQFPYELMNFGTQTPLPSSEFADISTYVFDRDPLLRESSPPAGQSAILSQSSTQTDLDYLFNDIQTQTDCFF